MPKQRPRPLPYRQSIEAEWVIDDGPGSLFDKPDAIRARAGRVPAEHQELVEKALRYMFLSKGEPKSPILYPNGQRKEKLALLAQYLTLGELRVFTYLTNRTRPYPKHIPDVGTVEVTKSLRNNLGTGALRRMQAAFFRCESCGMPHVYTLTIDHVNGIQFDRVALQVLCANCHIIKSHNKDFHKERNQLVARAEASLNNMSV